MNTFVLAACFASPTPPAFRLGPAGWLRLLAGEFRASMLTTSWRMPRGQARMRIHDGGKVPVLLVHGYGCNSGYWDALVPLLDAARISHAGVDLAPVGGDIDGYAPQLQRAAEALCAATGAAQVMVVAHSMGGLVARAWMRAHGSGRVARLVTLGTPHNGSALARFGPGVNAGQMRRSGAGPGAWLGALAANETPATRARIVSLYTHHDNIVSPQTSSVLPGARNIDFGGIGHVRLGSDARVLAQVLALLEESAAHPAPSVAPSRAQ
jgi:triacylglycerol esterase/lipase EstA (alpha/beta hydrolase family)